MKTKNILAALLIFLLVLVLSYVLVPGSARRADTAIENYTVSPDGKTITLQVGVTSSAGYIRDLRIHQQEGGKLYLDAYAAFGGINGRIGAKDTFVFTLDEDTSMIALYRGAGVYEEVLTKGKDGVWARTAQ